VTHSRKQRNPVVALNSRRSVLSTQNAEYTTKKHSSTHWVFLCPHLEVYRKLEFFVAFGKRLKIWFISRSLARGNDGRHTSVDDEADDEAEVYYAQ
jgi:hypothetical protein